MRLYDVSSILSIPLGSSPVAMVRYASNSSAGYDEEFYDNVLEAQARADALEADPPKGDHFHPAPEFGPQPKVYKIDRAR